MHRFACLTLIAALAATVFLPGAPAQGQQLSYGLPSPATAAYQLVDTTSLTMSFPGNTMEAGGNSSFTYMVTFESGGEGVQVAGELSAFAGSSTNPMAGTASVSRAQAGVGDFALVLGRQGLAEVVSTSRRADSDLPLLVNPHAVLFPRLPAGELAVGDSWTDTVTTYLGGTDAEKVVVYTYTLAGDASVDGRAHLRITVSGAGTITSPFDSTMPSHFDGEENGFFLWDVERGLVAESEVSGSYEGSMDTPEGVASMVFTATTRVRLENAGTARR